MLPIVLGLAMGFGLPIQTAVNSRLRNAARSPLFASLINFCVGSGFLLIALVVTGQVPALAGAGSAETSWWMWCGGLLGFTFLTLNILLFGALGGVESAIWPVTGQVIMALAIDTGGWLGTRPRPLTAVRALGAVAVVAGVVLSVTLKALRQRGPRHRPDPAGAAPGGTRGAARWMWRALGVGGGVATATQATVNGQLAVAIGSPIGASVVNFGLGTALLLVVTPVVGALPRERGTAGRGPWWMWFGGVLGGTYVLLMSRLAPVMGTGLTMVLALVGQTAASICVDHFAWLGAPRNRVVAAQVVGLVIMVAGAVLVRLG